MSILIKSGKKYYAIPANVLNKCKISKAQYDKIGKKKSADVAGQCWDDCSLVDLSSCCMDKKSLWASCL